MLILCGQCEPFFVIRGNAFHLFGQQCIGSGTDDIEYEKNHKAIFQQSKNQAFSMVCQAILYPLIFWNIWIFGLIILTVIARSVRSFFGTRNYHEILANFMLALQASS